MLHPWRAPAHLCIAALLLAAPSARAQLGARLGDPSGPRALALELGDPAMQLAAPAALGWALDLGAATSVPLAVGVEAQAQSPWGVTAHLALGHAPSAYFDLVRSILLGAGVYPPHVDPLVREAIGGGGWIVRVGLGFTIAEGLELAAGYTYLAASAQLSPNSIDAAVGQPLPWRGMTTVPFDASIHALHARVGWRFVVERHLVLRLALGWAHTVGSAARVDLPPELDPAGGPADTIEAAFTEGARAHGFTPELVVSIGYRL